ncbi:hypothetical protein SmJEL517_g04598 [Synchytrium microbalum]|uniref:SAM domain-containing protein n=1 Tax=Synchytrium microbalum TaxID=1806994 RepID=A0A507C2V0_9FUNG|nr:uncharacterized protein SmJEL517_g04598 [Synchytrium microbalum]TPX32276.1 hypothetical protein SmJEL517_g04598 [Synchytrium microbalum]
MSAAITASKHASMPVTEPTSLSNPQRFSDISSKLVERFNARPSSEILAAHYKSPEAEAIDKWFEDLSKYETTLDQMAKAKLDENFREELKAIEQWFTVLSDPERTTALYTLLLHTNPVQIRFFLNVLTQMNENSQIPGGAAGAAAAAAAAGGASTPVPGGGTTSSSNKGAAPSPAASPRPNPIGSPIQRGADEHDTAGAGAASRSRRPLYDRHSAPQDGSLGVGLLAFSASMASASSRLPHDGSTTATGLDDGFGEYDNRRLSAQSISSTSSSRAVSPSMRPKTPENGMMDWNNTSDRTPKERTTSLKRMGLGIDPVGLGLAMASMSVTPPAPLTTPPSSIKGSGTSNGYRLADMPLIAPRGSSLVSDEAGVVAAEVANMALAPPSVVSSSKTPTPAATGFATPRPTPGASRPITPIGIRSPASTANLVYTPNSSTSTSARSTTNTTTNMSPPHDPSMPNLPSMNISPPHPLTYIPPPHHQHPHHHHLVSQSSHSSLHSQSDILQRGPQMHPGQGWGHIDMAKTRPGQQLYATSDYSDGAEDGMFDGGNSEFYNDGGAGGMGGGGMKGRARNGSVGSAGHKEKGKIPESMDLEALNDVPSWLRSLRLHKYTPIFEGMTLKELVQLSDEDLSTKGVSALGARRKLTKVFEMVKAQLDAKGIST